MSICGEIANLAGENQSLRARIAELEELKDAHWAEACAAKADIDWVVNNYGWAERGGENVKETVTRLVEQRDAAKAEAEKYRAGEARAVEALRNLQEQAAKTQLIATRGDGKTLCGTKECIEGLGEGDCIEDWGHVEGCPFVGLANTQPALDWLAQVKREAATEELRKWAERWWQTREEYTAADFTDRAAQLERQPVSNSYKLDAALRAGKVQDAE